MLMWFHFQLALEQANVIWVFFSLSGGSQMCCRFTTYCRSVFAAMYFLVFAVLICFFTFLLTHNRLYTNGLIALGIYSGVGLFPTTFFLIYYLCSRSSCCRSNGSQWLLSISKVHSFWKQCLHKYLVFKLTADVSSG